MQRSYPLRWLALALSLLGTQCQDSLSDDCTKTLTCPDTVQPVLDENCIWRYPDDTIWTGAPAYDADEHVWRWPDGTETATQTFNCTPLAVGVGDAGTDAGSATACRVNTDCDVPLVCDTVTSRCVECLTSAECADHVAVGDAGAAIACDQVRHVCVPCVSNENCSGDTPVCKTNATSSSRNECVQCTADADCGGDKPICDLTSNECTSRCTSSQQCLTSDKSVCNLATELCVECTDATTCSGSTSQCNTATNECVQCIDDVPCVGNGRVCDTTSNNCVQCTGEAQCQNVPEAPHCELDTNICVQCLTDQQCTNPNTSRCNPVSHLCVGCTDNAQCEDGLLCDVDRGGICRQCLSSSDCPAIAPACETSAGRCVECLINAECRNVDSARCETGAGAGDARYTCVGCVENGDCSGGNRNLPGLCRQETGTCVDCVDNGDCSLDPTRSRCGNGGVCAVCLVDGDCNRFGGLQGCVPNQGCVECTADTHCSDTPQTPTCKLSNAGAAAGDAAINTCVQCTENNDCTSPTASRCVNNECVACAGNNDCTHLDTNGGTAGGTLGICDSGTCVECTGPQRGACGPNVCNSSTKQCTAFAVGSAGRCDTCVSDAHCEATERCTTQLFEATTLGPFCFPATTGAAGNTCSATPYSEPTSVTTVDGVAANICMLRRTTCTGLAAVGQTCDQNSDCGQNGRDEGRCPEETGICTIPCTSGLLDCFDPDVDNCAGGACEL